MRDARAKLGARRRVGEHAIDRGGKRARIVGRHERDEHTIDPAADVSAAAARESAIGGLVPALAFVGLTPALTIACLAPELAKPADVRRGERYAGGERLERDEGHAL